MSAKIEGPSHPLPTSQLVWYDVAVKTVGMFDAKTHFSALIDDVVAGEEVLVTRKGVPVAKIVPVTSATPRIFGIARALFESGEIEVADDFDDPLPPEMMRKLHA